MRKYLTTLICSRVSEIFRVDHKTILMISAIVGILAGFGFLFGNTQNSNYITIIEFAPKTAWALWFFIYGTEKVIEILFDIPAYIKGLNSLFGMWIWNYIVLSFLYFDKTSAYPLEYIVLVPLLIEVWFLTSLIYIVNTRKEKL